MAGGERLAAQWVVWSATVQGTYWKCPLQVHHFIIKETNSTPRCPHSPPSAEGNGHDIPTILL